MADLTYDVFQEVVKGLPVQDVVAMCGTQRAWRDLCQRPTFWEDLIFRVWNYPLPNATPEEYSFFYDLYSDPILERIRDRHLEINEEAIQEDPDLSPDEIQDLRQQTQEEILKFGEVISIIQDQELQAYLRQDPILYWQVNPLVTQMDPNYAPVKDTFIQAYTLGRALLRLDQIIPDAQVIHDTLFDNAHLPAKEILKQLERTFTWEQRRHPLSVYLIAHQQLRVV